MYSAVKPININLTRPPYSPISMQQPPVLPPAAPVLVKLSTPVTENLSSQNTVREAILSLQNILAEQTESNQGQQSTEALTTPDPLIEETPNTISFPRSVSVFSFSTLSFSTTSDLSTQEQSSSSLSSIPSSTLPRSSSELPRSSSELPRSSSMSGGISAAWKGLFSKTPSASAKPSKKARTKSLSAPSALPSSPSSKFTSKPGRVPSFAPLPAPTVSSTQTPTFDSAISTLSLAQRTTFDKCEPVKKLYRELYTKKMVDLDSLKKITPQQIMSQMEDLSLAQPEVPALMEKIEASSLPYMRKMMWGECPDVVNFCEVCLTNGLMNYSDIEKMSAARIMHLQTMLVDPKVKEFCYKNKRDLLTISDWTMKNISSSSSRAQIASGLLTISQIKSDDETGIGRP